MKLFWAVGPHSLSNCLCMGNRISNPHQQKYLLRKRIPTKHYLIFFILKTAPPNLVLVKETLSRIPHIQWDSALTGRQGLQKIREQLPNLILLDMGLPDIEGLDVIRELKKHSSTQNIPIMVLSASALKNQIDQAKALGIEHYLTKPFEINEFVDLIHQYSSQSSFTF